MTWSFICLHVILTITSLQKWLSNPGIEEIIDVAFETKIPVDCFITENLDILRFETCDYLIIVILPSNFTCANKNVI